MNTDQGKVKILVRYKLKYSLKMNSSKKIHKK